MEVGWSVRELIFGGTFDPIHIGHLLAAEQAVSLYKFNKVIFVPAGNPWMKPSNIESAFHRINMIKLAISSNPAFVVSDVDIQRRGPTYMIDTLADLNKGDQQNKPCILMGSDILNDIQKWHRYEDLIKSSQFFVMERPGFSKKGVELLKRELISMGLQINMVDGDFIEISAKEIRQKISKGLSLRSLVPKSVENYINKNKLYKS